MCLSCLKVLHDVMSRHNGTLRYETPLNPFVDVTSLNEKRAYRVFGRKIPKSEYEILYPL